MHFLLYVLAAILVVFFVYQGFMSLPPKATPEQVAQVQKMIDDNAIFIASKSNCPHCKSAIATLFYEWKVPVGDALVLQLDTMEDGPVIQQALEQINGQRTVPHIYIGKEFIGGNDKLQQLSYSGALKWKLEKVVKI